MNSGKMNTVVAIAIFMAMLSVYLLTVSPAISFWDSSEFITCSYIMGIPHPPGSPLLTLLSRVMMIIPFYDFRGSGFESIAYRANLLAVLLGALTVMLFYLITVRLITRIAPFTGAFRHDCFIMFCALVTAFLAGFSHQFWENSVEIETYMPALFISMLSLFLVLTWEKNKHDPYALRYLFLAVYIIGLGMGIHLYVLLVAPALFFLVITAKPSWFSSLKMWLILSAVIGGLLLAGYFFGRGFIIVAMIFISLAGPFLFTRLKRTIRPVWKNTMLVMLLCLSLYAIGQSVYPTTMIRAAKNPAINEGNPDTRERYSEYLNRSQYGQGNMFADMFHRNASFKYQFGYMYFRYLIQQFPKWGPSMKMTFTNDRSPNNSGRSVSVEKEVFLPVILVFLLLYGLYFHFRNDRRHFGVFFLYFVASSIGLVLYLNMKNPQVRERDYFFMGSFHIMMLWIGIGMYGVISLVRNRIKGRISMPVTLLLVLVFGTLIPAGVFSRHIDPDYSNFQLHDRSKNLIPFDYAVNMLESCEKNAVLFTHGDNDTYPLWYVQHVEGIRTDVAVINLSILNAPWYIKQLRDGETQIPVAYSDDYIDDILGGNSLRSYKSLLWTPYPKEVTVAGLTWNMPPTYLTSDRKNGVLSVSSVMIIHIIGEVNWKRPVYFSSYVDPARMIGLLEYMSMEGMVFRLTQEKSPDGNYYVKVAELEKNIYGTYRYRGVTDTEVYKSQETVNILQNYFIAFVELLDRYAEMGKNDDALRAARNAYEFSLDEPARLELIKTVLREKGLEKDIDTIFGAQ